jgi:hypothetical protein
VNPRRAIDNPIERLPPLDEHGIQIDAPSEVVWPAMIAAVRKTLGHPSSARLVKGLGSEEVAVDTNFPAIGSTLPGFVVARVVGPAVLALEGEHDYARYAVVFVLDPLPEDRTLLRAQTRADFKGTRGKAFRRLTLGTHLHGAILRQILRKARKQAEKNAG